MHTKICWTPTIFGEISRWRTLNKIATHMQNRFQIQSKQLGDWNPSSMATKLPENGGLCPRKRPSDDPLLQRRMNPFRSQDASKCSSSGRIRQQNEPTELSLDLELTGRIKVFKLWEDKAEKWTHRAVIGSTAHRANWVQENWCWLGKPWQYLFSEFGSTMSHLHRALGCLLTERST